jgi:hypothetical protein
VINLFSGDTLSGLVTDQTEIKCENEDNDQMDSRDNSGTGSESSGDAQGDGNGANCTSADLTPRTVVHEAEVETEGGSAVFEKVELGS